MRISILVLILWLIINLLVDGYILYILKQEFKKKILAKIQLYSAIIFALGFLIMICIRVENLSDTMLRTLMWVILVYAAVYSFKYTFVTFDLISRIPQIWHGKKIPFLRATGFFMGLICFFAIIYGAFFGRFQTQVTDINIEVENLPQ